MPSLRRFAWIVLLLAGAVPARWAQAQDVTLPVTGIIPNYDRVAVGQAEALEGGAYVARSGDAGSNWYNPAGLVQVDKVSVNAAASGYELTSTSLEGLGTATSRTRFTPVGRYFGLVVGRPIVKGNSVRLGISFSRPVGWDPGVIESSIRFTPTTGGEEILGFNTLVTFNTSMPTAAAGFRISDRLRVGASATLAVTTLSVSQLLADRLVDGATASALDRTVTIDGSSKQFIFAGGVQWDATDHLRLGAQVRTPGLVLGGSAVVAYNRSQFSTDGTDDVVFRDEDAKFSYKYPLNLVGGVAWVDPGWAVEVNVRYHGAVGAYDLVSSEHLGQRVVYTPDTDPVVTNPGLASAVHEAKSVVNLAIGGSVRVSNSVRLHAGFFNDGSPVANEATSLFRQMDLTGGSVGASLAIGRLSGSLGFTGSVGTSGPRDIGPSLGGTTTETRIKVQSVSFIYALAYNF